MAASTELRDASPEQFQAIIARRRQERMSAIDDLPADLRGCVHDYGLTVVSACMDLGIKKARHIRHLVETVLDEFSPTRGSKSAQGARPWRKDDERKS